MPSAPMMTMQPASKPKIGFSIESIVGNRIKKSPSHFSPNSEGSDTPLSPLSDSSYQQRSPRLPTDIHRALNEYSQMELHNRLKRSLESSPPPPAQGHDFSQKHLSSPSENSVHSGHSVIHHSNNNMHRQQATPSPPQTRLSGEELSNRSPSPTQPPAKKPIVVPGIPAGLIRPAPQVAPQPQMNDIRINLPPYPAEMISAAQNHFFRLGIFKQLLP
jgi:homeobox protein EMX